MFDECSSVYKFSVLLGHPFLVLRQDREGFACRFFSFVPVPSDGSRGIGVGIHFQNGSNPYLKVLGKKDLDITEKT